MQHDPADRAGVLSGGVVILAFVWAGGFTRPAPAPAWSVGATAVAREAEAVELQAKLHAATADRDADRREAMRGKIEAPDQELIPATTLPTGDER